MPGNQVRLETWDCFYVRLTMSRNDKYNEQESVTPVSDAPKQDE